MNFEKKYFEFLSYTNEFRKISPSKHFKNDTNHILMITI